MNKDEDQEDQEKDPPKEEQGAPFMPSKEDDTPLGDTDQHSKVDHNK